MPYSWNRPPVPIDKNKQGGKNMDASQMTDFRKIEAISAVRSTKVGFNNRNLITNMDELRRTDVMRSGLATIPRLYCPVCPSSGPVTGISTLGAGSASALTGIKFFVVFTNSAGIYTTPTVMYRSHSMITLLTNLDVGPSGNFVSIVSGVRGIGTVAAGSTRQSVVDTLNGILSLFDFTVSGVANSKLVASVDSTGHLVLTLVGGTLSTVGAPSSPPFIGLFFGDAPNGSTSLGATNQNDIAGVGGSALLIRGGSSSVTAPYIIADPAIFS